MKRGSNSITTVEQLTDYGSIHGPLVRNMETGKMPVHRL
jgi:hypothetical protein